MSELYLMKDRFRGFLPVVVDCETGGFDRRDGRVCSRSPRCC